MCMYSKTDLHGSLKIIFICTSIDVVLFQTGLLWGEISVLSARKTDVGGDQTLHWTSRWSKYTLMQCQSSLHEQTLQYAYIFTLNHCTWRKVRSSVSLLIVPNTDVRAGFGSGCSWKSIRADPRLIRRSGGFLLRAHPGLTHAVHLSIRSGLII